MNEIFNQIENKKIIPFRNCEFAYVEHKDYLITNPLSDYFFRINDLSINIFISLK